MIYQNFDLEIIASRGDPRLHARVLQSPQGDSPFINVTWPFETEEENAFLAEIYGGLRQRRARVAKAATVEEFGGRLFDAVFTGDIEHLFRSSLDAAYRNGEGLRIRLRLPDDSALNSRPWEFLFDTESREFLAVKEHTPLVRYLPVAQPIAPIAVEGPVRILVALAAPTDHPRLDVTREWEILSNALKFPMAAGKVKLDRVPGRCTFDNLRDALRHFGAHVFHFIGHGIPGALVLEQETGKGLDMEATQLRAAFPRGALPRLVVLNSCSGAIGEDVPFSGLAQGFLRQGVPAVVAMQASITDDAALIFTRYFYRDLIETGIVDASLTEARLRMQGNGQLIEWGTPVLYMRALNGQLFQPGSVLGSRLPEPRPREPVVDEETREKMGEKPGEREGHGQKEGGQPVKPGHLQGKPQGEVPRQEMPSPPGSPKPGAGGKPAQVPGAAPAGSEPARSEPTWGPKPESTPAATAFSPGADTKEAVPPFGTEPLVVGRPTSVEAGPEPPIDMPPPDRPHGDGVPRERNLPPSLSPSLSPYVKGAGALLLVALGAGAYLMFRHSPAPAPENAVAEAPPIVAPTVPQPDRERRTDGPLVTTGPGRNPAKDQEEGGTTAPDDASGTKAHNGVERPKPKPSRAAADGCNNPDVGERLVDCLLKK